MLKSVYLEQPIAGIVIFILTLIITREQEKIYTIKLKIYFQMVLKTYLHISYYKCAESSCCVTRV